MLKDLRTVHCRSTLMLLFYYTLMESTLPSAPTTDGHIGGPDISECHSCCQFRKYTGGCGCLSGTSLPSGHDDADQYMKQGAEVFLLLAPRASVGPGRPLGTNGAASGLNGVRLGEARLLTHGVVV